VISAETSWMNPLNIGESMSLSVLNC